MANAFKPGDVVHLPTTSPHMTVEDVDRGRCWCVWFDGRDVKRDAFPVECLEAVKPTRPTHGLTV